MSLSFSCNQWCCREHTVTFELPCIMGILNVTPDSFYAESRICTVDDAVQRGLQMVADGATVLDIGGESTRPGAVEVSPEEELSRVLPVIEALHQQLPNVVLSIDTRHLEVARRAVAAGASVYNDVDASLTSVEKAAFVAESGVGYCVVHNCTESVGEMWTRVTQQLLKHHVKPSQLVVDAGFGFCKSSDETVKLLAQTRDLVLRAHPYPYLIAASRKRFIGALTQQTDVSARGAGSLSAALWAVQQGAQILRVHDVRATMDAIKVFLTLKAEAKNV